MEKKFLEMSNETLAYLDFGGDKDPIILIHGNMSSSLHYSPIFSDLQEHFRVIAVDLRGFGDSSYNQSFNSCKELAADVKEFCDLLGLKEIAVVGWSAGAGVALEMAIAYPDLVRRLFSIEGVGYTGFPILKKDENGQMLAGQFYSTKEEMAADPVQIAPVVALLASGNAAVMSAIWDATIYTVNKPDPADNEIWMAETMKQRCLIDIDWALANFNLANTPNGYNPGDDSLAKILCPCAFTAGDKDIVIPPGPFSPAATVAAIGAKATLIEYSDCGHSPLVDVKDQLVADIIAFCK